MCSLGKYVQIWDDPKANFKNFLQQVHVLNLDLLWDSLFTYFQGNADELQAAALMLQQHNLANIIQDWFFENFKRDLHTNVAPRYFLYSNNFLDAMCILYCEEISE